MTQDTEEDAHARRSTDRDTFRPHVPDRFERRVRDDHAPNAALHSTLRALAESDASRVANVNLMASHAPGEKDHEPTYDVVVDIENGGAGTAATYGTIVRKLVQYDDVVITDAESSSIVPESDAYDGDGDYPVDRLTLHLRPVETRVEPIELKKRDLPSGVYPFDTIRFNAAKVLDHAIEEEGSNGRTYEAARCFATFLYLIAPDTVERSFDADAAGREALDDLLDRVDHDFEFSTSPDGMVDYVDFEDLDTPCVTYECSETATDSVRYQFPSGYVVDAPVCDLHADDFDRSLLSHPLQDEDAYHAIDFEGNTVEVPHFEDEGDVVAFARAYLDAYDVDHPVEPSGYAKTDDNGVPYEDATGEEFEPYSVRREKRPNIDLAIQDRDDASIVAKVEGEKAGEWHKVDTGRGIYNARVDVEVDAYPEAIEAALPDGWSVAATDVFESFDMRRYTIDVYNRAYGRHRDDADDVDRSGTAADGIASGLGLAATAEAIDRRDDGDGVERGDVDLPDEVIGKALYKGTLAYNDEGRLVDNRDAMREGGNE